MSVLTAVCAWLTERLGWPRGQKGTVSIEYVLVVLAVVLFMVVAAAAMTGVLNTAVAAISAWIAGVSAPAPP